MLISQSKIQNGADFEKFKVNEMSSTVKMDNCYKICTINAFLCCFDVQKGTVVNFESNHFVCLPKWNFSDYITIFMS